MQWKPNRSKPLIAGIPLKRPSQEQVNKAYMLFYSMIGGFASVVQTQITDVYNYARQDKKLFRMEAKKRLTEAKRCSDELVESFMFYMGKIGMQQIWLDLTDAIEDDIRPDIQKCFYALDNQFLKFGIKQHKLYTLILMAEILSRMLCKSVDEFLVCHAEELRYDSIYRWQPVHYAGQGCLCKDTQRDGTSLSCFYRQQCVFGMQRQV